MSFQMPLLINFSHIQLVNIIYIYISTIWSLYLIFSKNVCLCVLSWWWATFSHPIHVHQSFLNCQFDSFIQILVWNSFTEKSAGGDTICSLSTLKELILYVIFWCLFCWWCFHTIWVELIWWGSLWAFGGLVCYLLNHFWALCLFFFF